VLHTVYGDEVLSRSRVSEWLKWFKDGREDLQNDPRSRCPSTSRNSDTIANIHEAVTRGRRLAIRMMADELNISNDTIRQSSMKIYRRGRSARSSVHTDSRMNRSNGESHHAKVSSRLVSKIPISLLHFISFLR
jgi:hypothetical protein